jgi:hypothetical protein
MLSWLRLLAFLNATVLLIFACTQDQMEGPSGMPAERIPVTVYFQGALTGRSNHLVIHAFPGGPTPFQGAERRGGVSGQSNPGACQHPCGCSDPGGPGDRGR